MGRSDLGAKPMSAAKLLLTQEHARLDRLHTELCRDGQTAAAHMVALQMFKISDKVRVTR